MTTEERSNGDVVKLCLNEIDSCVPFFIGMLGSRYGWHLTGDKNGGDELQLSIFNLLVSHIRSCIGY